MGALYNNCLLGFQNLLKFDLQNIAISFAEFDQAH